MKWGSGRACPGRLPYPVPDPATAEGYGNPRTGPGRSPKAPTTGSLVRGKPYPYGPLDSVVVWVCPTDLVQARGLEARPPKARPQAGYPANLPGKLASRASLQRVFHHSRPGGAEKAEMLNWTSVATPGDAGAPRTSAGCPFLGSQSCVRNGNATRLSVDFTAHTGFVPNPPWQAAIRSRHHTEVHVGGLRPDRKPSCRALRQLHQAFRASRSASAHSAFLTGRKSSQIWRYIQSYRATSSRARARLDRKSLGVASVPHAGFRVTCALPRAVRAPVDLGRWRGWQRSCGA